MRIRGALDAGYLWISGVLLFVLCHAAAGQVGTSATAPVQNQASPTESRQVPSQNPTSPAAGDIPKNAAVVTSPTRGRGKNAPKSLNGLTFLPELKPTDGVPNLQQPSGPKADQAGRITLDRAVAVINGEVILASDVLEQQHLAAFEPVAVPTGQFTPLQAMQQIVNRTLLLQQMAEQQLVKPPSDAAVNQQIDQLRKHLPICANHACDTEQQWRQVLERQGYTPAEFQRRWAERMQILNFVEVRFRTGIRIAKPEIEKYYRETLVPQFEARKLPPPSLASVSSRIDEVLLQQHVNVLLTDYLRSLKDAGNVQILDPAYAQLGNETQQPQLPAGGAGRGNE